MHIKTTKVKNPKNVIVQIPGFIAEKWNLQTGDGVEMHVSEEEDSVRIIPRKGYVQVSAGSRPNESSKELVRDTIRCES